MFRKLFVSLALATIAISSFAAPTPKQVEDALAANNYTEAKSLVSQVLREHPDSARAHLLKAYILAKVDKNKQAANDELRLVESFDKSGKVKNSPLFGRTVAVTEALSSTTMAQRSRVEEQVQYRPAPIQQEFPVSKIEQPVKEESSHWFLWTLLILSVVGILAYLFYRSMQNSSTMVDVRPNSYYPETPSTASSSYRPNTYFPVTNPGPVYTSPTSSALGTAAAVAGGVVAGELISDALRNRHTTVDRTGYRDTSSQYHDRSYTEQASPVVTEDTTGESTEVRRDSFNSGGDSTSWTETEEQTETQSVEPVAEDNSWPNDSPTESSSSSDSDWKND